MDNRIKEIVENFDHLKIGLDDPFKFHCTMCGKCCINREDILLTPRDIYNMSRDSVCDPEISSMLIANIILEVTPECQL